MYMYNALCIYVRHDNYGTCTCITQFEILHLHVHCVHAADLFDPDYHEIIVNDV